MAKNLPCGVAFMRGALLLLNIIFVLASILLIGIGIYIRVDNNFSAILNKLADVSTFEAQSLGFLAFVLIGGGIFTLLISLFGCAGRSFSIYINCISHLFYIYINRNSMA
jgi:hypothetical protein